MPVDGDVILSAGLDVSSIKDTLSSLKKTVSRGLKNAIRIGLGVRSIFALIRKLRTALFEGFGDLSQVYQPFNSAMSQIMTSLSLLRNSFVAAFAPIVETVAPILSSFINMVAEAVSQVGQFIAVLTGKEYVRAAAVQVNYADSVNKSATSSKNAANATKEQNKAAKELKRTLAGFDDVEILHEDKDTSSPSSSGTTASPSTAFAPTSVGSAVETFAKDFLAAWKKADFTDIGRVIGQKLKSALDSIPWDNIKTSLRQVAKSIATFLNGFIETPGLFSSIGVTLAQGINSAVAFAENFVKTFHWSSLGKAVGEALQSGLGTIDWDAIYNNVNGFGVGLARFLNNLFTPDTFKSVGTTIANYLNAAVRYVNAFATTFDFSGFGNAVATGINATLSGFNASKFASTAGKVALGIKDAIVAFLSGVNWYEVGFKIRELLVNIPWKAILYGIGRIIWEAINAAVKAFAGFFDIDNVETPFADTLKSLQEKLQGLGEAVDWEAIADGIGRIVTALAPAAEGFATGFLVVISGLVDLIEKGLNLLGPLLQKIADALMSIDPDTLQLIGVGLGIVAGALLIINGLSLVGGILGGVAGAIETIGGIVAGAAAGLGDVAVALESISGAGTLAAGALGLVGTFAGAFIGTSIVMTEELGNGERTFNVVRNALLLLKNQFHLTDDQINEMADNMTGISLEEGPKLDTALRTVQQSLEDAGVPADAFTTALQHIIDTDRGSSELHNIQDYVDGIGNSSETAEGKSSALGDSIDHFNDLGLLTPVKMALLSAAIKLMGDNGELSDEQVSTLQQTLDAYNPDTPEKSMQRVQKALEDTGISAEQFDQAMLLAIQNVDSNTKKQLPPVLTTVNKFGTDLKTSGETAGKNLDDGLKQGIQDNQKNVTDQAGSTMSGALDAMNTAADAHSPSRKTMQLGNYLIQGLQRGMSNLQSSLNTTATSVITGVVTAMSSASTKFTQIGGSIVNSISTGFSMRSQSLYTAARSTADYIRLGFESMWWSTIGVNITYGIGEGFSRNAGWLQTLAYNTALSMYYAACNALWIRSPSRKFAWVGEMITEGLGNGVEDNQDTAVDAVANMADAMLQETENLNPSVTLNSSVDGWVESLDSVLTRFSGAVVDKFESLIGTLERLGNLSSLGVPDIALGKVIPSQATVSTSQAVDIGSALQELSVDSLSREDLIDVLNSVLPSMFQNYLSFYIGDEQIARHANKGNNLLTRRYNPTTA